VVFKFIVEAKFFMLNFEEEDEEAEEEVGFALAALVAVAALA
jgi:hypothetical protein